MAPGLLCPWIGGAEILSLLAFPTLGSSRAASPDAGTPCSRPSSPGRAHGSAASQVGALAADIRFFGFAMRRLLGAGAERSIASPSRGQAPVALIVAFDLSPFDADVLTLAAAVALDPTCHRLAADLGGAVAGGVTAGLALELLVDDPESRLRLAEQLGAAGRLVARGLIKPPTRAGVAMEVIPTRRALAVLQGKDPLTDLPRFAQMRPRQAAAPLEFPTPPDALAGLLRRGPAEPSALAVIWGKSRIGKATTFARAVLDRVAGKHLEIDVSCWRARRSALASGRLLAELVTDAAILEVPVLLDNGGAAFGLNEPLTVEVVEVLAQGGATVIIVVAEPGQVDPGLMSRAVGRLELELPDPRGSPALCQVPSSSTVTWIELGHVGREFALTPREIVQAATAVMRTGATPAAGAAAQVSSAGDLLRGAGGGARLDKLILAADTHAELVEVISAVRARTQVMQAWGLASRISRGRGIAALFDGPPGTGKSMAGEIIAAETGLPMLRVNVATLVDKYIGETEKNLARVFGQARAGGSIICFDEADSVFGTGPRSRARTIATATSR